MERQANVCPFGDATAPYCFTYLMITLKKILKSKGVKAFTLYIDDLLVPASHSLQQAVSLRKLVIETQLDLNLVLGAKKCPPPSMSGEALGFWVDTEKGLVTFTLEKFGKIHKLASEIRKAWVNKKRVHARTLASLLGKIVSGIFLCSHTIGLLDPLIKSLACHTNSSKWDVYIRESPQSLEGVFEWINWCSKNPRRLWFNPPPTIWCSSDATLTSAAAVFWGTAPEFVPSSQIPTKLVQAQTDVVPDSTNIAVIEAFAIWWGLKVLLPMIVQWLYHRGLKLSQVRLIWATDNQACEWAFKKGRCEQPEVHAFSQKVIWDFVLKHNVWMEFPYIPSKINYTPDLLSRLPTLPSDWSMGKYHFEIFLKFCRRHKLPVPKLDVFASRQNRLLPRFGSLFADWDSEGSFPDIFKIDTIFWCNPPLQLIVQTLQLVGCIQSAAWVVIPSFQGPWDPFRHLATNFFQFSLRDGNTPLWTFGKRSPPPGFQPLSTITAYLFQNS